MALSEKERKDAESELQNWGRFIHDGWLSDHLLWAPPPTSEGYVAPSAYDPSEPVRDTIDEIAGQRTSDIICKMGAEPNGFDAYRVLVHWYPHLMMLRREGEWLPRAESVARLAKHMHCSFGGAERMLEDAIERYWRRR